MRILLRLTLPVKEKWEAKHHRIFYVLACIAWLAAVALVVAVVTLGLNIVDNRNAAWLTVFISPIIVIAAAFICGYSSLMAPRQ